MKFLRKKWFFPNTSISISKIGLQIRIGAIRLPKLKTRFNKDLKPSIKIYRPELSGNRLIATETTFNQTKDLVWS